MNKKYELTSNTRKIDGKTLYQIRALRDFSECYDVEILLIDLSNKYEYFLKQWTEYEKLADEYRKLYQLAVMSE